MSWCRDLRIHNTTWGKRSHVLSFVYSEQSIFSCGIPPVKIEAHRLRELFQWKGTVVSTNIFKQCQMGIPAWLTAWDTNSISRVCSDLSICGAVTSGYRKISREKWKGVEINLRSSLVFYLLFYKNFPIRLLGHLLKILIYVQTSIFFIF